VRKIRHFGANGLEIRICLLSKRDVGLGCSSEDFLVFMAAAAWGSEACVSFPILHVDPTSGDIS
jgi:hypothetical protein